MVDVVHASDCAVHNAPALPVGPCNCGAMTRAVRLSLLASAWGVFLFVFMASIVWHAIDNR